jgi:hypothetical protein
MTSSAVCTRCGLALDGCQATGLHSWCYRMERGWRPDDAGPPAGYCVPQWWAEASHGGAGTVRVVDASSGTRFLFAPAAAAAPSEGAA